MNMSIKFFQHFKEFALIALCFSGAVLSSSAQEMSIPKEQVVHYSINIHTNHCTYKLNINGLEILLDKSAKYTTARTTIGEYLKPDNNLLFIEVWNPDNQHHRWHHDATCQFFISEFDPVKQLSDIVINLVFTPNKKEPAAQAQKWLINNTITPTPLGHQLVAPKAEYNPQTGHYELTSQFNTYDQYIKWPWVDSRDLAEKNEPVSALPENMQKKLEAAYTQLWQSMKNKKIKQIKMQYLEMVTKSAFFRSGNPDRYFDSPDFEDILKSDQFKDFHMLPLDFAQSSPVITLDKKAVYLMPSPLQFCKTKPFDPKYCFTFNPRYCFNGKTFVIT